MRKQVQEMEGGLLTAADAWALSRELAACLTAQCLILLKGLVVSQLYSIHVVFFNYFKCA